MGRRSYIGELETAEKVRKWYVGVNKKARHVIKGYVGVNGKARQFWPPTAKYVYKFFKDGIWDHVPSGFNFTENVADITDTTASDIWAKIKEYAKTDKTIWQHNPGYTRAWSVKGIAINSNFVYDYDNPFMANNIYIPVWEKGEPIDENRAIIPAREINYYLKITALGHFTVQLLMFNDDESYPDGLEPIRFTGWETYSLYFESDTIETKIVRISSSRDDRYIDRISIDPSYSNETEYNEWLDSLDIHRYIDQTRIWSSYNTQEFTYGLNRLSVKYDSSWQTDIVETVLSDSEVYSITWRDATYASWYHRGGELLSKAPFTAHHVEYTWQGDIVFDKTVSAEQIVYDGFVFYRYRVDREHRYFDTSEWYPSCVLDEKIDTLLRTDGKLEYEFFNSLKEIKDPIQIVEISIIDDPSNDY